MKNSKTSSSSTKKKSQNYNTLSILLALLSLTFAITTAFFYHEGMELKNNPEQSALAETQELIKKVGALILLPQNELPTVATVTDPSLLANDPFFTNAKIGDRVLLYAQAKKAILYSPSDNKIIEVSHLNIDPNAAGVVTEE